MTDESLRTSNDLIRWLKLLTLPTWVKAVLALIMLLILSDALELLDWGLHSRAKDAASSAVMILTSGLPVSLIGVALVFGDGGVRKLESPTQQVLRHGIPNATLENLSPGHGDTRLWLMYWLPSTAVPSADLLQLLARCGSCLYGAKKEGYVRNSGPLWEEKSGHLGHQRTSERTRGAP